MSKEVINKFKTYHKAANFCLVVTMEFVRDNNWLACVEDSGHHNTPGTNTAFSFVNRT